MLQPFRSWSEVEDDDKDAGTEKQEERRIGDSITPLNQSVLRLVL